MKKNIIIIGLTIGALISQKVALGQDCCCCPPPPPDCCYGSGGLEPFVFPNTWTGGTSSGWNEGWNWSTGVAPGATDEVLLPETWTPYAPDISGPVVTIKALYVMPNNTLNIRSDGSLTITQNYTNKGDIETYSYYTSAGPIGSGSFNPPAQINCPGRSTHQEIYVDDWHYFAMPITASHANGCFDSCWIKYWDEPTASWVYLTDSSQQIDVMKGYAIWSNGFYHWIGKDFNYGPLGPLTLTGNYNYPGGAWNGWNLVGNSYPSCINWGTDTKPVTGWTRTNIDKSIYFWDGVLAQYAYFNGAGDGDSLNGGSRFIPSTLGFFVRVTEPNATGQYGMDNGVRMHCNSPMFKSQTQVKTALRVKAVGNGYSDELVVRFNENAKSTKDEYDTYKLFGEDVAPQIYTLSTDNELMAINSYPEILKQMVVPFGFTTGNSGEYTFSFTQLYSFSTAVTISLKDLKENTTIPLFSDSIYTFHYTKGDDSLRFQFLFANSAYGIENMTDNYDLQVYAFKEDVFIKNATNCSGDLFIYDLMGHLVYTGILKSTPLTKLSLDVSAGLYREDNNMQKSI